MDQINIVWLKRDLRTQDHAPLHAAEESKIPYIILYLFEPSLIDYPDTSRRHRQFIYQSLREINQVLKPYNRFVQVAYAEAIQVFRYLVERYHIQNVYSYQESGIELTWKRDKEVSRLLRKGKVNWKQFQRDGILRGITNRKNWDKQWFSTMTKPTITNRYSLNEIDPVELPFKIPDNLLKELENYPAIYQPAGESFAWKYLKSFVNERGINYQKHISKPAESRKSGGRISPYLAWGNISIKQAYQYIKNHINYPKHKRPFGAFLTRLKWHCHFIQKFEMECSYEHSCINSGYELLERTQDPKKLMAWKEGKTGFPLVDACMRCVAETGWINFRMRAMLVSFLCHHLDQDWKDGVYHLANLFLDYEPGIHYPQFQMQAGTTGINTVRIYNPVKQSYDHDPNGHFIKKWIPELIKVPNEFIHEPWNMTKMDQDFNEIYIGKDYPAPIVDLKESGHKARKKIWGHRSNPVVKKENQRILAKHTRANRTQQ